MIVQWCLKGLQLGSDAEADAILDAQGGILSNWFRANRAVIVSEIGGRLTPLEVDRHVNHFTEPDPATGLPYNKTSPFISLTCGTVERVPALATNRIHRALETALWFGSNFGRSSRAYVFTCWVLVPPRPAHGVQGVAEEIRDLNQYRRYSAFQTEGEVLAKIQVPDNQVLGYETWERGTPGPGRSGRWSRTGARSNPRFVEPTVLTNIREMIS